MFIKVKKCIILRDGNIFILLTIVHHCNYCWCAPLSDIIIVLHLLLANYILSIYHIGVILYLYLYLMFVINLVVLKVYLLCYV